MTIKKMVNANKEGQSRTAALFTNVGNIVEVRYNESEKRIEFYHNNGYLGSTSSKERIEGYAQVKKIENLVRGYHFTLDYYEGYSKEQLLEKEQNDLLESQNRKEERRLAVEKEKEAKRIAEEARVRAEVLNSSYFRETLDRYYFAKNAREDSLQSSISGMFGFFGALLSGKSIPTEQESAETWWRNQLQKDRNTHFGAEYLYQLNESGELIPILEEYLARKQRGIAHQQALRVNQHTNYQNKGRYTHCWRCGSTLTSDTNSKCSSCKWLICSCGACKNGCSSTH